MEEKIRVAGKIQEGVGGEGGIPDDDDRRTGFPFFRLFFRRQGCCHWKGSFHVLLLVETHDTTFHVSFRPTVGRCSCEWNIIPVFSGLLVKGYMSRQRHENRGGEVLGDLVFRECSH